MNWSALGAIGELIEAFGVIISLLYLGGQVRSSSRAARQAAAQLIYSRMSQLDEVLANNPTTADIFARGSKDLSSLEPSDRVQFSALMASRFRLYEELYHCHESGEIEEWAWDGVSRQLNDTAATPGWNRWWPARKHWFSDGFQRFVERSRPAALRNIVADFELEDRSRSSDEPRGDEAAAG